MDLLKDFPAFPQRRPKNGKQKMEKYTIYIFINIVLHIVDNLIHFDVENFVVNKLLFLFTCAIIKKL